MTAPFRGEQTRTRSIPMPKPAPSTITVQPRIFAIEAARQLGVAPATFKAMIARKEIEGLKIGGRLYVTVATFNAYVAKINGTAGDVS